MLIVVLLHQSNIMILFADDWQLYPTAFPNLQTTNQTFVRLASVYRQMGVKNHAFILALVNPSLVGIDPFDPHLTMEEMAAIAVECQVNPWFFFREVARAPALAGVETVMVEANRGNIALWWSFFNHIMITLIQIRQTGKSFSTDELMNYLMNIVCQNTQINLLTKDDKLRAANVQRLKDIMETLPKYLQQRTKDDTNNTEEISIDRLGNRYLTHVPQSSPKRAYNMGRGLTSPIFHIDEAPFQPNIAISLPAALAALGAAVDRAKQQGSPYGTIITTTAGKKDDRDGRFVFNLVMDSAVWTEKFFDAKHREELEWLIRRNSRAGVVRINATFNHRQLGKTDKWLKEKLDESLQKGDDADRDYFNLWTSGSQSSPFTVAIMETIRASEMTVLHSDISKPYGYITRWYIDEATIDYRMRNSKTVLSMDTSEASGGDDISLVLTDVETLETIAAGTYNETNLITFAEWVCSIIERFENLTAIIERRSTGAMLLDYLLLMLPAKGIDPFTRLFNTVVDDYAEFPDHYKEIRQPMGQRSSDIYVRYKKTFGFATSGAGRTSRTELYSTVLQNAAKRAGDRVFDKSMIDQIVGLVTRNGRIDHEQGAHDDLVIGWLLAHWFLTFGKNLSHYGIDVSRVMAGLNQKKDMTPDEIWRDQEQQEVRQRIEQIYHQLSIDNDEFVCRRLEHELRVLDRKIILEAGETYSVDALIQKATESKRSKRRVQAQNYSTQNAYSYGAPAHLSQHGTFSNGAPMISSDFWSH